MTFKIGDKGKTRGGNDYEIEGVFNGLLWVHIYNQTWSDIYTYDLDGKRRRGIDPEGSNVGLDLIPPQQMIEGWVNKYGRDLRSVVFERKDQADAAACYEEHSCNITRIACVHVSIPYSKGEGLEK